MVKTPRTRHSKTKREPVTIELEPGSVSRVSGQGDSAATKPAAQTSEAKAGSTDKPASETRSSPSATVASAASSSASAGSTPKEPASVKDDKATASAAGKPDTDGSAKRPASESASAYGRGPTGPGPTSARPAPADRPKPSRTPVFAAGIVGGVVALAAAGLLQYAGVLGTPAQMASPAPESGQVEADIAALKSELAALKDNPGAAPGADPAKVDALSAALDQVRSDVGALQKAVESGEAGDSAGLDALGTRIGEIETKVSALAENAGGAASADIDAIRQQIAGVEALAKSAGEANSGFDGRLGAIEQSLQNLADKVEAQSGQPKVALAIASAALKSAVERGTPFQSEIETFAAIAPDAPGIAELRTYAENGVATRADILAGTDAAANAMIAAAAPPKQDAGFFERLLTSAESLVTVRPIGAVEGAGVPETVARMEVAIQAGDLEQALAEYAALPEASQAAGASFADTIRARMEVEKLVDQAVAAAMKAE